MGSSDTNNGYERGVRIMDTTIANTYPVGTSELLSKYGHLVCPKLGISYTNIFNNVPNGTLRSNWVYFKVRKPLIAIDGGDIRVRTSNTKVVVDNHTRASWMKVWDDAHTVMTYDYIANEYREVIIE